MNRMVPVAVIGSALVLLGIVGKPLGLDGSISLVPPSGDAGAQPRTSSQVRLGQLYVDGSAEPDAVVGNGGWVVLTAGYRVRSADADPDLGLALERRLDGATWTAVDAAFSRSASGAIEVRTPEWSTEAPTAAVDYRIVSQAAGDPVTGGIGTSAASSAVTVTYENQRFYSGIAASIYAAAQQYCPSTAVRVMDLPSDEAGNYRTGSQLIRISSTVGVSTTTRPIDIRSVALHECSHERQWMNYGGTSAGHDEMQAAAEQVFSDWSAPPTAQDLSSYSPPSSDISPIEHAADCGAQALNPGGYLGYGGTCTPEQLDAGRRLLLGERY